MKRRFALSKTAVGILLVAFGLAVALAWLFEGHISRFLCTHYGDSWLTANGYLACYRAP